MTNLTEQLRQSAVMADATRAARIVVNVLFGIGALVLLALAGLVIWVVGSR